MSSFPFQNPQSPAPFDVLAAQRCINVRFVDFMGQTQTGEIVIHKNLVDDVLAFFEEAYTLSFPIRSVIPIHSKQFAWNDVVSCRADNSSGFNYRTVLNSPIISKHGFGLAFDINPRENIYLQYDAEGNEKYRLPEDGVYNPEAPGTLTSRHTLVLFMKQRGWTWGGDWTKESGRIDYQHFEKEVAPTAPGYGA